MSPQRQKLAVTVMLIVLVGVQLIPVALESMFIYVAATSHRGSFGFMYFLMIGAPLAAIVAFLISLFVSLGSERDAVRVLSRAFALLHGMFLLYVVVLAIYASTRPPKVIPGGGF